MNNEPIIGNSNGEGICTVENPFNIYQSQQLLFEKAHPSLPLYDSNNNLVRDAVGVRVVGPVWQFKSTDWHGWKNTDKTTYVRFEVYEQFADYYKKQGYDTRRIYLLAEAQKDSEEKKVSNGFWWCWECQCEVDAHNVTNEEKHDNCGADVDWCLVDTSPLSDKSDVEEHTSEILKACIEHLRNSCMSTNARLIFFKGAEFGSEWAIKQGATDQEKLMQGEWVKVSEVEDFLLSIAIHSTNPSERSNKELQSKILNYIEKIKTNNK